MPNPSLPSSAIRTAFETARTSFDAQRMQQGATRQIATAATTASGPISVEQAIASAARQTTVDFDFLIAQAQVESAMNPVARARTSSATGLYQFIESTWLETMERHGERFGLGNVSAQIGRTQGGTAFVSDPGTRQAILDLRNDPQIAALMAAGLAEDNRAHLAPILGRQPEHNELYLAHFLGAGGAGRFLSAMETNPNQSAADLFRRPAAANRPVFFEPNGAPRSLAGVMDYLSGKLERARANASASIPDSYTIAALSPPTVGGSTSGIAQSFGQAQAGRQPSEPPAYLIADEKVFAPQSPPLITGRNRPTISAGPTLNLSAPQSRGSMSNMLRSTFEETGNQSSRATTEQIKRAYDQLKALGF